MELAISELKQVLNSSKVDSGHGLDHALAVVNHTIKALESDPVEYSSDQILAAKLAALLHDADDHKFFPDSKDYDNARKILSSVPPDISELSLKMIKYVSCSTNGNSRKEIGDEFLLYPRWADRLESIGEIGIYRCWIYGSYVNRPYFTPETPRAQNEEELSKIASPQRFENYVQKKGKVGLSSMIDHYYDKLLHLKTETSNPYFQEEFNRRHQLMVDFVLNFGRTGRVDVDYLQSLKQKYESTE